MDKRILRRINKEIFNNNFLHNDFSIKYNENNIIIEINNKYKFILIDYPFRAPLFYINNNNYYDFIIPKNKKIDYILHNYLHDCLYCYSIIQKWCPTNTLNDLIIEYNKNKNKNIYYKSFIIYIIHNFINDKYIINDILDYIL